MEFWAARCRHFWGFRRKNLLDSGLLAARWPPFFVGFRRALGVLGSWGFLFLRFGLLGVGV